MFVTSFILFMVLSAGRVSTGVKITELKVPSTLNVDEEDEVILDCAYEVEESLYSQLDVKWYFNDRPVPIYMWIPGYKPHILGGPPFEMSLESGSFHLGEKEVVHKYNEHRAIKIVHPDGRHSGKYTCKVSTFVAEESSSATMIVYGLPERQYLNASTDEIDSHYLDVECQFLRVFPKPIVSLEWSSKNTSGSLTEGMSIYIFPNEKNENAFDVEIFHQIKMNSEEDMQIWCSLEMPQVGQKVQLEYVYTDVKKVVIVEEAEFRDENKELEEGSGEESGLGEETMSGDEGLEESGSGEGSFEDSGDGFSGGEEGSASGDHSGDEEDGSSLFEESGDYFSGGEEGSASGDHSGEEEDGSSLFEESGDYFSGGEEGSTSGDISGEEEDGSSLFEESGDYFSGGEEGSASGYSSGEEEEGSSLFEESGDLSGEEGSTYLEGFASGIMEEMNKEYEDEDILYDEGNEIFQLSTGETATMNKVILQLQPSSSPKLPFQGWTLLLSCFWISFVSLLI